MPGKAALLKRALAELLFTIRMFVALLAKLRRGDVALTVPAPFMLPYAFAAAARLKGAKSVLIMHDLYPDVLIMAGLLKPQSIVAKAMRALNAPMFRALDAVVIIGRDTEKLLLRYRGMARDKIRFIPNWATLSRGVRAVDPENPYRRPLSARFVVGLSGNLGFTHDPVIVFEAARLLRENRDIHFLLSGWEIGFDQLREMQSEAKLPNVTLVDRVEDDQLETFLSAADAWIIPYRRNVAGRIGAQPVLQSAGDRPPGDPGFRSGRRGGIDGDRTRCRLGRRARQRRRAGENDQPRRRRQGPAAGRARGRNRRAIRF